MAKVSRCARGRDPGQTAPVLISPQRRPPARNQPSPPRSSHCNPESPCRRRSPKATGRPADPAGVHRHRHGVCGWSLVEDEDGAVGQRDDPHARRCRSRPSGAEVAKDATAAPAPARLRIPQLPERCPEAISDASEPAIHRRYRAGVVEISAGHRHPPLVVGRLEHCGSRS